MSYETKLAETQQPTFAELYVFEVGATTNRYTTYDRDISFQGDLYFARPIKRGDFTFTAKFKSVQLRITAPIDPVLAEYVANAPVEPVLVSVYRVFIDGSDDNKKIFQGEVVDVTLTGNAASIVVENETDIFRLKIPKYVYQARCNNMLFDSVCGLSETSYRLTTAVTVDESDLVSADFALEDNGYYTAGHVRAGNDIRLITNHVGNRITLQMPFPQSTLDTGQNALVHPGCDKSPETCKDKFSNFNNWFGFAYIPKSNPTIWSF